MMLRLAAGLRLPLGPDDFCGLRPGDGGRARPLPFARPTRS